MTPHFVVISFPSWRKLERGCAPVEVLLTVRSQQKPGLQSPITSMLEAEQGNFDEFVAILDHISSVRPARDT